MKLQNYELMILLIGLVIFNVSYVMQPFFASRNSVKLRADKYNLVLIIAAISIVSVSFALFFTEFASVMIWIMLSVFLIISIFSWKHTLNVVKAVKRARWAYYRQSSAAGARPNVGRPTTRR